MCVCARVCMHVCACVCACVCVFATLPCTIYLLGLFLCAVWQPCPTLGSNVWLSRDHQAPNHETQSVNKKDLVCPILW